MSYISFDFKRGPRQLHKLWKGWATLVALINVVNKISDWKIFLHVCVCVCVCVYGVVFHINQLKEFI